MADPVPTSLPPAEAIRFLEAKGHRVGFDWRDVWEEEHAGAFTVAKMMRVDLLKATHASLVKALAEGRTFATWREGIEPQLRAAGWWGRQAMEDPLTGEWKEVQLGSPHRLRTIFDTNTRMAYASGQWERIERLAPARPYLRYVAVLDERTRDTHRRWHGTILPWDHPWWDGHSPPCGWFCRCTLQQLGPRDLERQGWSVTETPDTRTWEYENTRTGETQTVPVGVDPGFGYHKGKAARRAEAARRLMEAAADLPAPIAAEAVPIRTMAEDLADDFAVWYDAADLTRPKGEIRPVGLLRRPVLDYLRDTAGIVPESAVISAIDRRLGHAQSPDHEADGIMIPHEVMRRLPEYLAAPRAILWDKRQKALVYVFDSHGAKDPKKDTARMLVYVDVPLKGRDEDGKRVRILTNSIHTGYLMNPEALNDPHTFDVIQGKP